MSKLRVQSFAISIDGYGAGPNQDLQNPLGVKGPELMEWFFHTRMWRQMYGEGNALFLLSKPIALTAVRHSSVSSGPTDPKRPRATICAKPS